MHGVPSDQHKRAYAHTDVCIAVQCSDNTLPQLHIKCGIAKFCPGTHSALQAPMLSNGAIIGDTKPRVRKLD